MIPTNTNLPLRHIDHEHMTPSEVTLWLDRRERAQAFRRIKQLVSVALVVLAAALLFITIGFFTH